MVKFLVIDVILAYNGILGRPFLNFVRVVVSYPTLNQMLKFLTCEGIGQARNEEGRVQKGMP